MSTPTIPQAEPQTGLDALKGLIRGRSLLPALRVMHRDLGNLFQVTLPGFQPVVLVGPEHNRRLLVSERDRFLWRTESDPVTHLLRHGLLVEDHASHQCLRDQMEPMMQKRQVLPHIADMWQQTSQVTDQWQDGETLDMLVEMRKVALLILMGSLFNVDFAPHMERLWRPILRSIAYISPGLWIVSPRLPRFGYRKPLAELDDYLYEIIQDRRANPPPTASDLLSHLVQNTDWDDGLIRDQLLTMLIAGHDTSTALLAWALLLLGQRPEAMQAVQQEVETVLQGGLPTAETLGKLHYLDWVIKEALRLFPPIHVGNRQLAEAGEIGGCALPAGQRIMYSIYLSHRDPAHWDDPDTFNPHRFDPKQKKKRPPFTYVPFGGGPRNCIGAAFAQIEAKVVLAHIIQNFDLTLLTKKVYQHMGATLEPRPGVKMRVYRTQISQMNAD